MILNVYNKFYEKKNQIQFKDYIFEIYEDDILQIVSFRIELYKKRNYHL